MDKSDFFVVVVANTFKSSLAIWTGRADLTPAKNTWVAELVTAHV